MLLEGHVPKTWTKVEVLDETIVNAYIEIFCKKFGIPVDSYVNESGELCVSEKLACLGEAETTVIRVATDKDKYAVQHVKVARNLFYQKVWYPGSE